jgi:1-acyl-sn-glycerol-3-phosphate acyltransferase
VSFLDPPVLGAACPRRLVFIARSNLFEAALLGAFLRGIHAIPLRRSEVDIIAVREALARLRRGEAVAIFPEGGRQASGALGEAKRGVGLLAMKARAPIVPVLVKGTYEALPPGARRVLRAKIRVAFGPAIPYTDASDSPDGWTGEEAKRPPHVREQFEQLAHVLTSRWHLLERELS